MDALTGRVIWTYEIQCEKNNDEYSGCKASPVVGQNGLDDLVFFTVNRVSGGGARLIALNKADRLPEQHLQRGREIRGVSRGIQGPAGHRYVQQGA